MSPTSAADAARTERMRRVRAAMADAAVDALLLSHGADLPWLTGYRAMPLERLTMLVLPRDGEAVLVVPALEAPRVPEGGAFALRPWAETEDPVHIVASLLGASGATPMRSLRPGLGAFGVGVAGGAPPGDVGAGVDGHLPPAGRQGRGRDRRPSGGRHRCGSCGGGAPGR